ncbi:type VI secretion system-associated protein VasI [Vibrio sp. TBV020]|uniref:type VI secretion system-associated protein VasI n=1 Tax=Vibrio sp. TBV020 TaxID=3137398 RepID=UPI0038CD1568
MKIVTIGLVIGVGILSWASGKAVASSTKKWAQAEQCRVITERLERLTCFDQLFETPVVSNGQTDAVQMPRIWLLAFDEASDDAEAEHGLKAVKHEKDVWLTLKAQDKGDEKPAVLVMSCMDKISRIDLALAEPLDDARISVSIAHGQRQAWRSDDLGVVFSSAQGIPAIEMMKNLAKERRIIMRSNSERVDGLQFDTSGLQTGLRPLRKLCGW